MKSSLKYTISWVLRMLRIPFWTYIIAIKSSAGYRNIIIRHIIQKLNKYFVHICPPQTKPIVLLVAMTRRIFIYANLREMFLKEELLSEKEKSYVL